ncbi:hypothetical protein D3C80_1210340 [compost metagenome]
MRNPGARAGQQHDLARAEGLHLAQKGRKIVQGQVQTGHADHLAARDDRIGHRGHQHGLAADVIGVGLDDGRLAGVERLGEIGLLVVIARVQRLHGDRAAVVDPVGQEVAGGVRAQVRSACEGGVPAVKGAGRCDEPAAHDQRRRGGAGLQHGHDRGAVAQAGFVSLADHFGHRTGGGGGFGDLAADAGDGAVAQGLGVVVRQVARDRPRVLRHGEGRAKQQDARHRAARHQHFAGDCQILESTHVLSLSSPA